MVWFGMSLTIRLRHADRWPSAELGRGHHRRGRFFREHLSCVVLIVGAIAYVDQGGFDVCAATVVGEANGIGLPISDQQVRWTNFPERAFFYFPAKIGAHQSVGLRAVDGNSSL